MTKYEYIDPLDFEKNKKIILESNLFDKTYYLNHNPDVEKSGRNALEHWINNGYEESRNPNIRFNNLFYRTSYLTEEKWNSLTHFIKIGEPLGYKTNYYENSLMQYDYEKINRICNALNRKISIFLLVFEISDILKDCIVSIIENTELNFELILLSNEKLPEELDSFLNGLNANILIKENQNMDYLNHINSVENDFVIMNNYASLSPNWLKKLIIKSYSQDDIDIAYPLSNLNTDINTPHIPNKEFGLTKEGINDLFNKFSLNLNVASEYVDASCFFVKNDSLEKFTNNVQNIVLKPEEKIFAITKTANLKCVLDDTTYIHIDEELFSYKNKILPILNKEEILDENINTELPQNVNNNLRHIVNNYNAKKLYNRILFIIDKENEKIYHDFLFNPLLRSYECYFLTINHDEMILCKDSDKLKVWKTNFNEFPSRENKKIFFNIINSFKIDLVQLATLKDPVYDAFEICKVMRIPIVVYEDYPYINAQNNNKLCNLFNYADVFLCDDKVKQDNLKILQHRSKTIHSLDNPIANNLKNRLKFNFNNKIKILIPHDIDENLEKLLFNLKNDEKFLKFEFHMLGETSPKLDENCKCYGNFSHNKLELIESINPEFLFISQMFDDIFNVLDISFKEKIPCFIKDDEILIDSVDQQPGMAFVNENSIDEKFSDYLIFDNYCNLVKEICVSDTIFDNKINFFAQTLTETYLKYQNELKLIKNPEYNKPQIKKANFNNFDGFLSHSYLVPVIDAPFREEEKACFATMDNITKYLISKLNNSPNKPFVSIIMPVFNRKEVVLNAINSVLNQTYADFELIIVDDASSDGTKELLNSIDHRKIRVFTHETNLGSSYARNTGLKKSKGDIIMYLDSDNEWDSKYIETMVGAFNELPDADAVYSGQLIYDNCEEPISMRFGAFNKSLLHNANYIDINCFCHKRHVLDELGRFDETLNRMVDWDFILRISNSFKIYSVPVLLSKYYETRVNNRITTNTASNISLFNSNVNYIKKIREKNKMESKFKGKLNRKVSIIIPNFNSLSNLRECIRSIQKWDYGKMVRIIVVDNNSNDAVRFYLKSLSENNEIDLIQNDMNYGFTYALNQGIEISDSNSDILLMNNNALLTKKAIESLQNVAYNIEDCGLVVPQQILPGRTPSINVHVPYATNIFECDITPSMQYDNIINVPTFHDGELLELNFAQYFCLYLKRDVLDNSVGFDAELGRDGRSNKIFTNYIRNVMGLKMYHTSNALVYHNIIRTSRKVKNNNQSYSINLKNQWEEDLLNEFDYKKALWDY